MPLYVFRCERCDREIEELQKFEDPPPTSTDPCEASTEEDPCVFAKAPTTFSQRWLGEYGSEGRGGWTRQGQAMVRAIKGKESTKYGEGTV